MPIDVHFDESTTQVFNVGAASCGVPGTAAGLAAALERFGTMPMEALIGPAVRHAREGSPINRQQAYVLSILEPIYTRLPECRAIYAPEGRILGEGEAFRFADLASGLEMLAAEGPEPFYEGELGRSVADFVCDRGGILSRSDMAAYRPIERRPVGASYRGCRILTNPPPSSGGILIAYALELLERGGEEGIEALVGVMGAANEARGEEFSEGLYREGFSAEFLSPERLDAPLPGLGPSAGAGPGDRFGSTTHLVVIDAGGVCASVTCSNGTGSGLVVPGTGIHVNNMLGEEDLNPHGFHRTPAGRRIPSMMSPTIVLREDQVIAGLGSAGSNRIRSAVLQTVVRLLADGMGACGGGRGTPGPLRGRQPPGRARRRRGRPAPGRGCRGAGYPLARAQPLLRRGPGGHPRPGDGRAGGRRRPAPRRRRGPRLTGSPLRRNPDAGGVRWDRRSGADPHLAVRLGPLGDLLGAGQGLEQAPEHIREQRHPLALVADLQQLLLGLGRKLDPGRQAVGVLRGDLGFVGALAGSLLGQIEEGGARGLRVARVLLVRGRLDHLDLGPRLLGVPEAIDHPERADAGDEDVQPAVLEALQHLLDRGGAADRAGAVARRAGGSRTGSPVEMLVPIMRL